MKRPPLNEMPKPTFSSRRVNKLLGAVDGKSYLEIGIAGGSTFLNVNADYKVAVDPVIRFDTSSLQSELVRFHEMTSDRYFSDVAEEKFDVIFIDGLHTHQQAFRDFCASFACSHDNTVWLIDDILPSDIYSSWPNQAEAVAVRKKDTGRESYAWHGDVFRVLFLIRDFFPGLSYSTISNGGNPQVVVWKQPRTSFKTKFNDLERISRLNYFDVLKLRQEFNFAEEDQVIAMVIRAHRAGGARRNVGLSTEDFLA